MWNGWLLLCLFFYFLLPVLFNYICAHSGRSFLCVRSPHATREADSAVLLIIFVTDLQQLLQIETSLQYHQPQTRQQQQAVRTGCLKITLVVKWDQSVPSVGKAMHNILSCLPLFPNLILYSPLKIHWLITFLIVSYTCGILLPTVICYAKWDI
jgi:hypothetical protein